MSDGSIAVTNTAPPIMTSRKDGVHFLMHTPTAAWVAAWSARREILHPQFLYTGGDDSALRRHLVVDIPGGRKEFRNAPIYGTLQNDQTTHGAGVTAIVPLWTDKGDVMLTGSYDEYIRVLHIKKGRTKATVMAERQLDGGVWQLKLLQRPSNPQDPAGYSFPVLASCSQAGCKIVEIHCGGEGNWNIEVLAVFMDPESIRPLYYASDFQVGLNGREVEDMTYVSTSFYDKKLCVWKVEDEEVEDEEVEDEEVEGEEVEDE
ncbi:MAG: hypothetical protein Q9199_005760 [Rusavskia elegans]